MASDPIITFKAGRCELDGKKVRPDPTPGYIYLYSEDELLHFCWRPRSEPTSNPESDLIMFPGDCTFKPYLGKTPPSGTEKHSPTNGRIFVLKFSSSPERHFFWMQAKSQHKDGTPSWFSARDQRIGEIINQLLAGEDVDVENEVQNIQNGGDDDQGGDDDIMEDVEDTQPDHHRQGSGGAGPDATGGDPREEGEDSRRGGEDGGRAPPTDPSDPNTIVQNFLRSLQGSSSLPQQSQPQQQSHDKSFTTLPELLNSNTTIPFLHAATPAQIDALCQHLPPSLFLLEQESDASTSSADASPELAKAAIEAMAPDQKKDLLGRVLRSPQLHQSLGSLTVALRDGGLPMIGEALGVKTENGGRVKGGTVPLGGGEAVEAFLEGVKRGAQEEEEEK